MQAIVFINLICFKLYAGSMLEPKELSECSCSRRSLTPSPHENSCIRIEVSLYIRVIKKKLNLFFSFFYYNLIFRTRKLLAGQSFSKSASQLHAKSSSQVKQSAASFLVTCAITQDAVQRGVVEKPRVWSWGPFSSPSLGDWVTASQVNRCKWAVTPKWSAATFGEYNWGHSTSHWFMPRPGTTVKILMFYLFLILIIKIFSDVWVYI